VGHLFDIYKGDQHVENHDNKEVSATQTDRNKNTLAYVLGGIAIVLVLTWAVSTFFGFALVKALAGVILVLFAIAVALFMAGVG
jgi:polyferredoxin